MKIQSALLSAVALTVSLSALGARAEGLPEMQLSTVHLECFGLAADKTSSAAEDLAAEQSLRKFVADTATARMKLFESRPEEDKEMACSDPNKVLAAYAANKGTVDLAAQELYSILGRVARANGLDAVKSGPVSVCMLGLIKYEMLLKTKTACGR